MIFFYSFESIQAQSDMSFFRYLVNENYLNEATQFKQQISKLPVSQTDSFYWLSAQLAAKLKRFDSAALFYEQIKTRQSKFYPKNLFSAAFNQSLSKDYIKAYNDIQKIQPSSKAVSNLKTFQLADISLLNRDLNQFDNDITQLDSSFYAIKESSKALVFIASEIRNHKSKSPTLAAFMSTIIPGSGKYYAGRIGEAFSAFLSVSFLSALVIENYQHYGINHGRTYLSLGFFGVFYIGNIWGSYYSVKRTNKIFNEKVDNNLLYHQQYTYDLFYR